MQEIKKISKTKNHEMRLKEYLKFHSAFLFGEYVEIGAKYTNCISESNKYEYGAIETQYYDEPTETLVAYIKDTNQILMCSGDMAVYNDTLYVENADVFLSNRDSLFRHIEEYLSKNFLDVTEENVFRALRSRFYKLPIVKSLQIFTRYFVAQSKASTDNRV